jgi:hypothetical protein
MDNRLTEIYEDTIPHSAFSSRESIENCMVQSYNLGLTDVLNWLKENNHLSDNTNYLIEEFKNQRDLK